MSYDFDERTDEPKRYCPVSKLSQQEMPETEEPRCNYCCQRLAIQANWTFSDRRNSTYRCKSCSCVRCEAQRNAHGGFRKYATRHQALSRLVATRVRAGAKVKGKSSGSIDEIQAEIERFLHIGCAICGCALRLRGANESGNTEGCLQVDCIDPRQGYIVGNIQGLCPSCNRQKDNHTLETAERLYKHLLAHEQKKLRGQVVHMSSVLETKACLNTEKPLARSAMN